MTPRESTQTNPAPDTAGRRSFSRSSHIGSAIMTAGALAVLVVVLWRILDIREDAHVERVVKMAADGAAMLIEQDIQGRMAHMHRMARRWQAHDGLSRREWEDDITTYLSDHPGFKAIAWVDEMDKLQWVVPWEGTEEAHGINLGFDPERRRILKQAREERRPVLSRIVQLLDGQAGFLALVPLEDRSGFAGDLLAVFQLQHWLDEVFRKFPAIGVDLSIFDSGRIIYPRNTKGRPATDIPMAVSEVDIRGHRWELRAAPTPELEAEIRSPHPPIVLAAGLVIAAIAGVTVGLGTLARRRAEQYAERLRGELAHAARVSTLGEMATGLAHEVNQPLSAITNYCELAKDMVQAEDRLPQDLGYALDQAVVQARRARDIIQNVRTFLRRGEPELARLEFDAVAHEALLVSQPEARDKGVHIELALAEDLPAVNGNRLQLVQVLVNLILNSIEAMTLAESRQKEISVKAATVGAEHILVTVQDTGPGIDAERGRHLFDAFETDKPDGIGMGLAICRTIVEAHGGKIRARTGKTGGAEFTFTLPISGNGEQ